MYRYFIKEINIVDLSIPMYGCMYIYFFNAYIFNEFYKYTYLSINTIYWFEFYTYVCTYLSKNTFIGLNLIVFSSPYKNVEILNCYS